MSKHDGIKRTIVGIGKAWAYSVGLTRLGQTLGRIGGNLAAASGYVWRKLQDGPHNYRRETFAEAVARLGLDEAHLVHQARAFDRLSLWWQAAALLASLWLAGAIWSDAPISHVILSSGAIFATMSLAFSWRFRACQIRDRELYSFGLWFWSLGRRW